MQRSLGLAQVDEIYLTHFHADHILGLPGLLKTYDLTAREEPLTIYGPRGLRDLFKIARAAHRPHRLRASTWSSSSPGEAVAPRRRRGAGLRGRAQRACQRLRAGRGGAPGRFDPEAAKRLGVPKAPPSPPCSAARRWRGAAGPVRPDEVMGESRPGRTIAITGDTAPCHCDRLGRRRRRAVDPRRQLLRGGGAARRRDRSLDRRSGGRGRPRGRT